MEVLAIIIIIVTIIIIIKWLEFVIVFDHKRRSRARWSMFYRVIELLFFIHQIILSAVHMPGTVFVNGTGKKKKKDAPSHYSYNIAYIY